MSETVKAYIDRIELPKNEHLENYFYVDRVKSEAEYNGNITPLERDGSTNAEFYSLFLTAHAEDYFKIRNNRGNIGIHNIKNEYHFDRKQELQANDIDSTEIFLNLIDINSVTNLMATQYIKNSSILFIDLTTVKQFFAGKIYITFNLIKYLDELLIADDLTRIYKHFDNFYFINYGL